jgi:hypothetical protein
VLLLLLLLLLLVVVVLLVHCCCCCRRRHVLPVVAKLSASPWRAARAAQLGTAPTCVPQMNRTEARPKPCVARAACAACTTAGLLLRPR